MGTYVPVSFADIWSRVCHDWGSVTDRSVQRALRALIDDRQIASLGSAAWAPCHNRSHDQPGFYLRYDSPRLWQPNGLRDLLQVVADCAVEARVTSDGGHVGRPRRDSTPRSSVAQTWAWTGPMHAVAVDAPSKDEVDEFVAEFS